MHRNEVKNIMHVINLQTLSQKKLGIISLIKGKEEAYHWFFEWKIHFNRMPKVSGLSQYNIACIFHGHLNKILYKLSECFPCPRAITSIYYWLNFKWFALNSARHWASQATLPSGPGEKVTESGEMMQFKPEHHACWSFQCEHFFSKIYPSEDIKKKKKKYYKVLR